MSSIIPKRSRAVLEIPTSWRGVGQSEHFMVEHDVFHDIVRVTRTTDAYPDTNALREAHTWLQNTLESFERGKIVLVWDGRRGKLRNDLEFERAIREVLPAVTTGWRRFVSINKAPVMRVQFSRWEREGTSGPIIGFLDEEEALRHAREICASTAG